MKRLLSVQVLLTAPAIFPGRCLPTSPLLWGMLLGALSACSFAPPWPDMPMPETMTRADIEHYRAREQDRLQQALRECYQRFAVNDCRREAMTRHNEVQHQLRAQELRLNALHRDERQRKLQAQPDEGRSGSDGTARPAGTPP
jgi:hypothetical protein